jgi:hypothetical protein
MYSWRPVPKICSRAVLQEQQGAVLGYPEFDVALNLPLQKIALFVPPVLHPKNSSGSTGLWHLQGLHDASCSFR